jgi:Rap1a immunity proteins
MFQSRYSLGGFALIALLMLSGGKAFAVDMDKASANYVMQGCRGAAAGASHDPFLGGLCNGLISGVLYMRGLEVCELAGVTHGQELAVVAQYIDARPARMHEDFRKLALEALTAAWPCKR